MLTLKEEGGRIGGDVNPDRRKWKGRGEGVNPDRRKWKGRGKGLTLKCYNEFVR